MNKVSVKNTWSRLRFRKHEILKFLWGLFWRRQWHPLQYSCLENPMDGRAWWAVVHGVTKSWRRLSNFTLYESVTFISKSKNIMS